MNNNIKLLNDKRFFIIDIYIYIYKYFFYYKKFYKKNCILIGFLNFIFNFLKEKKPTYIVVIFDTKLKYNYKKIYFINYKINRKKIPKQIIYFIPKFKKILKLLNIPFFYIKNYEADDVIGTIIKKNEKRGFINYIITEDKDFYQLISNKTFILNIKKKKCIDINFILNKYNIKNIKQYIDIISLVGDKSDNIPGIPNVGFKTANILLKKYNNIENIFSSSKEEKYKKKILKYKYLAKISKKLFKIKTNLKIKKKIIFFYRKKINFFIFKKILLNINKKYFNKKIKNFNYFYI
ncbi:MAG: DNA polymerase I [Candidatus Shikimatogenerans bostrichidophilus]|nr:MAG: DNA polymerase I [Candidatus Shikimatogenerans bostrichidophilus]